MDHTRQTSSTAKNMGCKKVVSLDKDTYQRWCTIGSTEGLSYDWEVGRFLIQMYDLTKNGSQLPVCCLRCENPLTLVCDACRTSQPQPLPADTGARLPLRGDVPQTHSSSAHSRQSGQACPELTNADSGSPSMKPEHHASSTEAAEQKQSATADNPWTAWPAKEESADKDFPVCEAVDAAPDSPNSESAMVEFESSDLRPVASAALSQHCSALPSVADNRDTLPQMAWSVAESKALARYIQVNTMQSSTAWGDCAAFLNTAFGTSRSGEACRKWARQQKMLEQKKKRTQINHIARKGPCLRKSKATASSKHSVTCAKVGGDGHSDGWAYEEVVALRQYMRQRTQERQTRRFWMDCAQALNARFGLLRTVTEYKAQHNLQKSLAGDNDNDDDGDDFDPHPPKPRAAAAVASNVEVKVTARSKRAKVGARLARGAARAGAAVAAPAPADDDDNEDDDGDDGDGDDEAVTELRQRRSSLSLSSSSSSLSKREKEASAVTLRGTREEETAVRGLPREDDWTGSGNKCHHRRSLTKETREPGEGGHGVKTASSSSSLSSSKLVEEKEEKAHSQELVEDDGAEDAPEPNPTCLYMGVEDLDVQLPSKDHNYIDRQQRHQQQQQQQQQKKKRKKRGSSLEEPAAATTTTTTTTTSSAATATTGTTAAAAAAAAAVVYICKACGRAFEKRHRLVNHIRYVHCDWRPFLCGLCQAAFQSRARLRRHECVAHTKERPYRCAAPACGASFVDRFALNCHARTHQADRPHRYFCELCGKGYHGLNPLKKHLLSRHRRGSSAGGGSGSSAGGVGGGGDPASAGAKTVLCWVCGKAVASASYLKLHLKRHSPDSAVRCSVCRKTFTSKQVLEKHLRSRVHQRRLERKNDPSELEGEEGGGRGGGGGGEGGREYELVDGGLDKGVGATSSSVPSSSSFFPSSSSSSSFFPSSSHSSSSPAHNPKSRTSAAASATTGAFQCEICDKRFASQKSRKRHKRTIHHCHDTDKNPSAKLVGFLARRGPGPAETGSGCGHARTAGGVGGVGVGVGEVGSLRNGSGGSSPEELQQSAARETAAGTRVGGLPFITTTLPTTTTTSTATATTTKAAAAIAGRRVAGPPLNTTTTAPTAAAQEAEEAALSLAQQLKERDNNDDAASAAAAGAAAAATRVRRGGGGGKFTCDICLRPFSLRQSVRRHKRNVHLKRRDYACDACGKTFTDSYYLKQHRQVFHDPSGRVVRRTVRCDVCGKAFLAKSAMTMHKRTVHFGLRRQACPLCCKRFRDKFTLERHLRSCRRELGGATTTAAAAVAETTAGSRPEEELPEVPRVAPDPARTRPSLADSLACGVLSSSSAAAAVGVVVVTASSLSSSSSVSLAAFPTSAGATATPCFTGFHPADSWASVVPAFDSAPTLGQGHGQVHGPVHGSQGHGQVHGQAHGQVQGQGHDQVHGQGHGSQAHGQVQGHGHGQVHGSHGHGQLGLGVGQQLALAPDVVGTDANALESVDLWNLG